jgi:filamentous hemagglutinin
MQTNHLVHDPVAVMIGGYPGTGGTTPDGSSPIKDRIEAIGGKNTVHNCYGNSSEDACEVPSVFRLPALI